MATRQMEHITQLKHIKLVILAINGQVPFSLSQRAFQH